MTAPIISEATARRFILGCQGLWPGRRVCGRDGVGQAVRQAELIQVDPLNVVGRSHDLALHGRVQDYRVEDLDHLLYTARELFDYGGTLYVLPMEELPFWRVHMDRRAAEDTARSFADEHRQLLDDLRRDVANRGPVSSRDYKGNGRAGAFRSGKDSARALRHLWMTGELMTHGRRGFERLYHLREEVAPASVGEPAQAGDADAFFAQKALALLGLATAREWAHRFRHLARRRADVGGDRRRLDGLIASDVAAEVRTADGTAHYLLSERMDQLDAIEAGRVPTEWRSQGEDTAAEATLLAPLEFVSARGRAAKWFGFEYIWEVYKPASKRRWGYYVLPILVWDRLVGRTDVQLDRPTGTLQVRQLWLERPEDADDPALVAAIAAGLRQLCRWVGGGTIAVGATTPPQLLGPLRDLTRS